MSTSVTSPSTPSLSQGYRVGPETHTCAGTGAPLTPGQPIVTVLLDTGNPAEPFRRLDFDHQFWSGASDAIKRAALAGGRTLGWWRSAAGAAQHRPRMIDDASLMELFEQLSTPRDEAQAEVSPASPEEAQRSIAYAYMLALILLRRKKLAPAPSPAPSHAPRADAGGQVPRVMWVRHRLTKAEAQARPLDEAPIRVEVPSLSEPELITLTDQLMRTLMGDGPATPAPATTSGETP